MRPKKSIPDPETCAHCKHFDNSANQKDTWGWCNRYPPVVIATEREECGFSYERPSVEDCDSCGEFKRRLNS